MANVERPDRVEYTCDGCSQVYYADQSGNKPNALVHAIQRFMHLDLCPNCQKNREGSESEETAAPVEVHAVRPDENGNPVTEKVENPLPSGPSAPMHPSEQAEYFKSMGMEDVAEPTSVEAYEDSMRAQGLMPKLQEPLAPTPTPETAVALPEGVSATTA